MKNKPLELIEQMYNAHYAYLRNYLIGFTRSHEEADDVIQELFSKILRNPQSVLEIENVRGWLVTSVRNTFLDFYRKKRPELLKDEKIMEHLLVSAHTPEDDVLFKNQMERYLEGVSSTDQAIFIAKEYYGYKYEEISELLNISVPNLKSRIFRMRKKMIKRREN